jgi:hypothetical protein
MKIRTLLVSTLLAGGTIASFGSPASARPPVGGCGAGLLGPLTFAQIIDQFPPPPEFPDPEGALDAFDANDDDKLCVMPHPDGQALIVVDNNAVGRS